MPISDEQVAEMAAALQERRLADQQTQVLHQAIDNVYNDIRVLCELCMSSDVPESVRQPLFETTQDIGCLRNAFRRAHEVLTGDTQW
jgi:hypothetical protein